MIGLFKSRDARIKELEEQVAELEKKYEKAFCRTVRLNFHIEEFKKFSPRLWFEYFSGDAGRFSAGKRAQTRFDQWRNERSNSK